MTNQTPIEKAAEAINRELFGDYVPEDEGLTTEEMADIIRRRLEKEVPKLEGSGNNISHLDGTYAYDQCRRDIGLRDDTEEA